MCLAGSPGYSLIGYADFHKRQGRIIAEIKANEWLIVLKLRDFPWAIPDNADAGGGLGIPCFGRDIHFKILIKDG